MAHWTFDREALESRAADYGAGTWRLRLWRTGTSPELVEDRELPSESSFCFLPAPQDATPYGVELGHATHDGQWRALGKSEPTITPARFPTDPPPAPAPAPSPPSAPVTSHEPGPGPDPTGPGWHPPPPDPAPDRVLHPAWQGHRQPLLQRVWRELRGQLPESSDSGILQEVIEGIDREAVHGAPPDAAGGSPPTAPSSADVGGESRPAMQPGKERDFWLEVNAEVILYGRTTPDARVTVAGRPVALRPDGSFSFRFLLPDGSHPVPVSAVSADGQDLRSARVTLGRATEMGREVGAAPVDPALHPPGPDAIG